MHNARIFVLSAQRNKTSVSYNHTSFMYVRTYRVMIYNRIYVKGPTQQTHMKRSVRSHNRLHGLITDCMVSHTVVTDIIFDMACLNDIVLLNVNRVQAKSESICTRFW